MGCASGTIKYTLFIFNSIWAVLGLLAIIFAAFGWDAMPPVYAIGLIIFGGVIISIAFFGCTGTMRESPRLLWMYVAFVFILLVLVVVFMCYNTRDIFKNYALKGVREQWQREFQEEGSMDYIQATYFCCGRDSFTDYKTQLNRTAVPASCCKNKDCFNVLNVYVKGCLDEVQRAFADEAKITQIYEWILFSTDLTIFVLAVILSIHYTNRRRRYNY